MSDFILMAAREHIKDSPIRSLMDVLDWSAIDEHFVGFYKREYTRGGGPNPYHATALFKAILLGQWHALSDAQLEHSLRVRLDFMVFTGFGPGQSVPDETTLCRFRNALTDRGLDEVLFHEINRQLEAAQIKVDPANGAIIDASIIPSAARPRQSIDATSSSQDGDEAGEGVDEVTIRYSADDEARWVKKHGRSHFGYRGYAIADVSQGFIDHIEVHPANESETTKLPE